MPIYLKDAYIFSIAFGVTYQIAGHTVAYPSPTKVGAKLLTECITIEE